LRSGKSQIQPLVEKRGRLYGWEISEEQKCTPRSRIVIGASVAFQRMLSRTHQIQRG
jgi:hypothetical protein